MSQRRRKKAKQNKILMGQDKKPVLETIHLASAATEVFLKEKYDRILRSIFHIDFITNSIDFTKFGLDAELDPPIQVKYNDILVWEIKSIAELTDFSYDVNVLRDDSATKNNQVVSRLTYSRFIPGGLDLTGTNQIIITKPDLSSSLNSEIHLTFMGWAFTEK